MCGAMVPSGETTKFTIEHEPQVFGMEPYVWLNGKTQGYMRNGTQRVITLTAAHEQVKPVQY